MTYRNDLGLRRYRASIDLGEPEMSETIEDNAAQNLAVPSAETGNATLNAAPSFTSGGAWEYGGRMAAIPCSFTIKIGRVLTYYARTEADARLIAAAPDLYAALRKIYYDNEGKCGCECDTETCCNRVGEPCSKCDARFALAKAEGK